LPTDSLAAVFAFSFVAGFGAVISPGPVSTAIVGEAPRHGWLVGPLVATGHSILEFLVVVLLAIGLTAGMVRPGIRAAISVVGGLLLIWMGSSYVWAVYKGRIQLPRPGAQTKPKNSWQLVGLGMVATVSNPFWYAWWTTVAAGYLVQAQALGLAAVAMFYLGHICADYAWDTFLSGVVGTGRRWLNDRVYRGIILLCGCFLIYLGGVFLLAVSQGR